MGLRNYFRLRKDNPPELLRFDHLFSEYQIIEASIQDANARTFIEDLASKKATRSPSWNDIYRFELILAKYLPYEKLRSKIVRLRYDYRSIVGQSEFDNYLSAKPPDLQSPPEPADAANANHAHYEMLLREDVKDLLDRMYTEYAILPVREQRINDLTSVAATLCVVSLLILLGILGVLFFVPLCYEMGSVAGDWGAKLSVLRNSERLSSLTIFVVVVTGALGGFVSSLQRLQRPTSDGDSIYNLSLLFHGSKSVFTAPITGAIFAIILYLMFSSGMLTGTFFPTIFTPEGTYTEVLPVTEPTNTNVNGAVSAPDTPSNSNTKPKDVPTPKPVPKQGLNIFDFLARSGPGSGKDYALLIIWCFLAGFAERFVPDALDRIISTNNPVGSK